MIVKKEQGKGNWFIDKTVKPKKIAIDINKLLSNFDIRPSVSGPAGRIAVFIKMVIAYARALDPGYTYEIPLQCRKRPRRKNCPGKVLIYMENEEADIQWGCPVCGDSGNITGEKTRRKLGGKTRYYTTRKETLH